MEYGAYMPYCLRAAFSSKEIGILIFTDFPFIIPSLTVQKIKKRYSPQFVRAPAIGALVLLYSNVQLAKMQALK